MTFNVPIPDIGYHLEMTSSRALNKKAILLMTKKVMPRTKVLVNGNHKIRLILPDEYTPFFPAYFEELTEKKEGLAIEQIKLSYVPFGDVMKKILAVRMAENEANRKAATALTRWRKVSLLSKLVMPVVPKADIPHYAGNQREILSVTLRKFWLLFVTNFRFLARTWRWNIFAVSEHRLRPDQA